MGTWVRGVAAGVLVAAVLVVASPSRAASPTPRWVLHAERFPAGLSQGVRAYASSPRARAAPATRLSSPAMPAVGPLQNVQANTDTSPPVPQNETAVAYDLSDPMTAVAAANGYVNGGLWIGRTTDGGQTWSTRFKTPRVGHGGGLCNASDPSVVYSRRDKAFYVSTLCFSGSLSEVDVWKSVDGGAHWTSSRLAARVASNRRKDGSTNGSLFYDKELLAVDNGPNSPHYGRLYATYIEFHLRPNGFSDTCPMRVAYADHVPTSNPSSATWHHVLVNPRRPGSEGTGPSANQWATPVVDSRHGLDIAYVIENCNSGADRGLFFRRSIDGGRTFGHRVKINKPGEWADDPNAQDLLPDKNARIGISPALAFDPTGKILVYLFENEVHRATSGSDISFARSTDFGAHWTHAHTLSVTANGHPAPNDQFFPAVAADGQGGLRAIWFDNRNDPMNRLIETWQAHSTDGGKTWTSEDISEVPWNPNRSFGGCGCFIGDYNGIAAAPTVVYPVWTDGRDSPPPPDGETDIWTNVESPP